MKLSGVLAPVPTPFDNHDQVDLDRLRSAFSRWLPTPLDGFVVLGSTGEAALLTDDEADKVVDVARAIVPAERTFLVGTGRESTQAAVAAARRAAQLGADALLVRTPGFFKSQMTSDALIRHYLTVADASPVPVLLYNFTAVTGVNLAPTAVAQLSRHPNIVGMKESGGEIAQIADLVAETSPDFPILAGSATTFYAALAVGAAGGILALACVLPEACVEVFRLVRNGRHDEARALQQQLIPVSRLIGSRYGVPGVKAALQVMGYDAGFPRPPLLPLPEPAIAELRTVLAVHQYRQQSMPVVS